MAIIWEEKEIKSANPGLRRMYCNYAIHYPLQQVPYCGQYPYIHLHPSPLRPIFHMDHVCCGFFFSPLGFKSFMAHDDIGDKILCICGVEYLWPLGDNFYLYS